ncbi:hypothetical protein IC617_10255 [Neiella sp. HB171785]|uniref:Uncharacterized protein n=1 Tax=Neiella litorisoli TaxID=2771431 RepID=A0A8J6QSB3_9GAMM|nr:hypothetical protein [Neiella litorisoli]MBD1389809.1 hypothetical protein [Neiella litorisoli]
MNKKLALTLALLLLLTVALSIPAHLHWSNETADAKDYDLTIGTSSEPIDWQDLLASVAQFQPPVSETAIPTTSVTVADKSVSILDGKLVGIVVDSPASILIFPANSDTIAPIQLGLGEGWLDGWSIQHIETDRVVWHNSTEQRSITQTLFQSSRTDG